MRVTVRRNKGFFVPESRLWYVGVSYWGVALTARLRVRGLTGHVT